MADEPVEPTINEDIEEVEESAFYEAALAGTNRILEMILDGASTSATLEATVRLVERLCPDALCAILTVEHDRFQYGAAPSVSRTNVGAQDALPLEGCSVAARLRKPIGTTDIVSDPDWEPYREWAQRLGLRACFCWPIFDHDDELLAIFTMYFRESRHPTWFEERMLERAAHLVGVALMHEPATAKIKLNEKRFRTLVNTTTEAVWLASPDGMLIADPDVTWGELTGQTLTEIAGRGWLDAVHPEDRDRVWQHWKDSFERGVPFEQTYRVRRADGTWAYVIDRGTPLLDCHGHVHEWIGATTDITRQRRAEERLRFLADAGALLGTEMDYPKLFAKIANKAARQIADYCAVILEAPDKTSWRPFAAGDPSLSWAPSEQHELANELARAFLRIEDSVSVTSPEAEGSPLSTEQAELLRTFRISSLIATPLRGQEDKVGVFVLANRQGSGKRLEEGDLTLAEELSRRIVTAMDRAHTVRDLEAAIQTRDDFLSVASHELKTPLTPLQLQIQAVERRPQGELPAWLLPKLRVIRSQVERFARLVDQLLDISRIAEGKLQLDLQPVDLDQLVREVVSRFEASGEISRSGSTVVLEGESNVVGHWDRLRLEQIINNLLNNALKYGERKPIHIRWHREGDKAILAISDLGIGIAVEDHDRIFTRFERAVSVRHYGGFGLGLFIVRQLVEAMGGHVSVTSALGQGATFKVVLPLAPSDSAESAS